MSFKREPLLEPEVEKQLKEKFLPLWLQGMSAKVGGLPGKKLTGLEIAQKLGFGVKDTPYAKLKTHYVYFYRLKWQKLHLKKPKENPLNFPPRKEPSFGLGEHRYKVAPDDLGLMSVDEFVEALNEKLPYDSKYCRRARSFLITLYWTPLRSSEIYERTIDDFRITKSKIKISLLRKKKHHKPGDKKEPISIFRAFPLAEEIVNYLQGEEWKTEKNTEGRPWHISHDTARNYVREVFGNDYYPHYFRFRFLTHGANDPKTSLAELQAKSKLTLSALEHYIKAPEKLADEFDRRELERLKEEGWIK